MKNIILISMLCLSYGMCECVAQEMLNNGDFEIMSISDIGLAKAENLKNWKVLTGSPDIYDEVGEFGVAGITPSSGDLFLRMLECESLYQKLGSPLLPGNNYSFSFFVQTRFNSNFPGNQAACGDLVVFGSNKNLHGSVEGNGCPSDAGPIHQNEYFDVPEISEEWSAFFWCFSPQDTIRYFGLGIEMPTGCSFSILIDNTSLMPVAAGVGAFADLFADTLNICPDEPCVGVAVNASFEFHWSDGTTGGVRDLCTPGQYEVAYEDGGCTLKEEILVQHQNKIGLFPESSLMVCEGACVEIKIDNQYDLKWGDGNNENERLLCEGEYEIIYEVKECSITEQLLVEEEPCGPHPIFAPNVFSPNGDGINDRWEVYFEKNILKDLIWAELLIFDRWGNLLIQKKETDLAWNGKSKRKELPLGTYTYTLSYGLKGNQFSFMKNGSIVLIR